VNAKLKNIFDNDKLFKEKKAKLPQKHCLFTKLTSNQYPFSGRMGNVVATISGGIRPVCRKRRGVSQQVGPKNPFRGMFSGQRPYFCIAIGKQPVRSE